MDSMQELTADNFAKLKPSSSRLGRRAHRFGAAALLLCAGLLTACSDEPPAYEPPEIGPRLVSDLLLERRWPNGVIPFKFAPNPNLEDFEIKKDRARTAMNGSTTIDGCTTDPCIGWGGAHILRFVECPPNDVHCGDYNIMRT